MDKQRHSWFSSFNPTLGPRPILSPVGPPFNRLPGSGECRRQRSNELAPAPSVLTSLVGDREDGVEATLEARYDDGSNAGPAGWTHFWSGAKATYQVTESGNSVTGTTV